MLNFFSFERNHTTQMKRKHLRFSFQRRYFFENKKQKQNKNRIQNRIESITKTKHQTHTKIIRLINIFFSGLIIRIIR